MLIIPEEHAIYIVVLLSKEQVGFELKPVPLVQVGLAGSITPEFAGKMKLMWQLLVIAVYRFIVNVYEVAVFITLFAMPNDAVIVPPNANCSN